jgi:hypothetical protein
MSDELAPDQPAPETATPAKKPRKPRAPRKKAAVQAPEVPEDPIAPADQAAEASAEPIVQQPETRSDLNPAVEDAIARMEAERAEREPAEVVSPVAVETNGPNLQGAKPRKSGRRSWEIVLGKDEHVWERVETPSPDSQIIFRFKDVPTAEQCELLHKNGFVLDEETKEARRPNDPTGRVYADKVSWYLKELQHAQGEALAM